MQGKTTLISSIAQYLLSAANPIPSSICIYWYFRKSSSSTRSGMSDLGLMLQAIVAQLWDADDTLLGHLQHELGPRDKSEVSSDEFLKNLVAQCLATQNRRVFILLDGIDECDVTTNYQTMQSTEIIEWFKNQILSKSRQVRLVVSGRRDGHSDRTLSSYPSLNIDQSRYHREDIEQYIKVTATQISERFDRTPAEERNLVQTIVERTDGTWTFLGLHTQ